MVKETSSQETQSVGSRWVDLGWVKIYRELLRKPIWRQSTPEQKSILITLILMADHSPQEWYWKGEKFKTEPGQFITSLEAIAHQAGKGISVQNVRGSVKRFSKKFDFLTNESTKTGRLITIKNWGTYQPQKEKPTNKSTVAQQRGNKEVTPNKNERMKEVTNTPPIVPPTKPSKFTPPTESEVVNYFVENGYTPESGRKAFKYYEEGDPPWHDSRGNAVKSWKQKMRGVWFKPKNAINNNRGDIKPTTYRQCQDAERRSLAEKALEVRRAKRNCGPDNLRIEHDVPVRGKKPEGNGTAG